MQRTQRRQHAFSMCQRSLHAVVGDCPLFFLSIRKKNKKEKQQHDSSLSDCVCAQSLTAHDVGKNRDHVSAVMSDSTRATT